MALAIEAAELMEHFQWISVEESRALDDPLKREQIGEELADIICYALALANTMELDVSEALEAKMQKNKVKYPVERYRGTFD
jgi:NTP pyrophosphatase (non-canonical NTP hydrolase)